MEKFAFFKLSHLALRTLCHAAVGICEHNMKSNSSSCVHWLNASSKSAAPSAPFVSVSKHLQCFVRIKKDVGKVPTPSIVHLNPVSVNSDSYDNFTILTMLLNSCNFQQRQINTRRKQEHLQPFLSARHLQKFAFFKWSHLKLRTFCHAPAGIWEQPVKSNSSSCVDWFNAWSKSAAPSAPLASLLKHLQCFVTIDLSKARWDSD